MEIRTGILRKKSLPITFVIAAIMIAFTMQSFAQNLREMKDAESQLEEKEKNHLKHLKEDIQTTIHLENNEMKVFGEGVPSYLKTDVMSLEKLRAKNEKYNKVVFLEIKLNEPGDEQKIVIDATSVSSLPNLQYLFIRSAYNLNKSEFEKMLSGFDNDKIMLLYEISIPN